MDPEVDLEMEPPEFYDSAPKSPGGNNMINIGVIVAIAALIGLIIWLIVQYRKNGASASQSATPQEQTKQQPKEPLLVGPEVPITKYATSIDEIPNTEWRLVVEDYGPSLPITFTRIPGSNRGAVKILGDVDPGTWIDNPTAADLNLKIFGTMPYTVKADVLFQADKKDSPPYAFRKDDQGYVTVTTGYRVPNEGEPGGITEQTRRLGLVK